ncbi:PREDICTED: uncharacterized protein LOC108371154 [Rhagoletis zephyria]|uniref:uncharacterized protein LOC108371154 n=1 Tax=Rhagoletis zephyria TaxID=28612 RepID=UPI00081164B1|nr:PREDICTED: uncharacterized protein LOC108371154 [Rhagoletis zephyria]XP_036338756.1 uncharacterized protein LOC118748444 isoform X2 [Rhagoletis pomonella]
MGSCCSKDPDSKTSWSPSEAKNASTTSTIVAQPNNDSTSAGVFTSTMVVPVDTDGANSEEITTTIIKTTRVTETVTTSSD